MKSKFITFVMAIAIGAATCCAAPVKRVSTFDKAYKAYEKQQMNEATQLFNTAIKENDRVAYAKAYLGSIKLAQEQTAEAITILNEAVTMLDQDGEKSFTAWAHSELSAAYIEQGDNQAALKHIGMAMQLQPSNAHYAMESAVIKYNIKDYNGARQDSELALKLNPDEEDTERAQALNSACIKLLDNKLADNNDNSDEFGRNIEERDIVASDNAILPKFAGGNDAMMIFIKKNIKYPKNALKKGIEGIVEVECCIDETGKVVEVNVTKGIDPECDKEALRVCLAMPFFTPGSLNGKPLKSTMIIPVKFKIKK